MHGETCDKLRIDLSKPEQNLGETYTALSRVRKLNDIIIINMNETRRNPASGSSICTKLGGVIC